MSSRISHGTVTLSRVTDLTDMVAVAVKDTLALARTWLTWDGVPRLSEDGDRLYTPHKAIRRTVDHLLDHLAQIEALAAGNVTVTGTKVQRRESGPLLTTATACLAQQPMAHVDPSGYTVGCSP